MAQKITIYRLLTDSQTAGSPESSVKFDGTTLADGKYNHIIDYKTVMSLVAQENPLPDSNNPNPLQDTGLAIMTFELSGYFDETNSANTGTGSSTNAIIQLRNWLRQDKTNAVYPFGCFGITNTLRSEFNVEPDHVGETYERGLILEHFEINQDYEYIGKTGFLCRFRYNGDINGLGV
jgi:hypothetical protein|tara:strand:- start:225 stop:758 length:534 start_codon:yes stop_codon:yes gene_type:complete